MAKSDQIKYLDIDGKWKGLKKMEKKSFLKNVASSKTFKSFFNPYD